MNGFGLTSRDLDDLLQLLFDRLRGRKYGLALAEHAFILLDAAREQGHGAFRIHITQYEPIILDAFISGTADTFGYDAQKALASLCADTPSLSSEYLPESLAGGLERIRARLLAVETVLAGAEPPDQARSPVSAGLFREEAAASTILPLVSSFETYGGRFTTSRLIQPRVELRVTGEWSTRRRHEPGVTFSHIFADPDSPFERQVYTAIGLAERLAARRRGAPPLSRLPRQYHISLPEIAALPASSAGKMSGGSAGLAFAALVTELIGGLDLGRGVEISPGTAFTGGVDESGRVLPVEDSFIGRKVRAAFYSTCRRLAVPAGNLPAAQAALAGLRREHPRRELELIPARTVGDLLADGRVARLRRIVPGRTALQRVFHWRKHLLAGVFALAAAFASIFILPAYLDRQVQSISITESKLVMKNRAGHLISEHDLGYKVSRLQSKSAHRLLVRDIDSQPGEEAVALVTERRDRNLGRDDLLHLYLFSRHGKLIRETVFSHSGKVKKFIDPSMSYQGNILLEFMVMDSDNDGYDEIYCLTHHGSAPPYSLVRFSLRDTTTAVFIHSGMLRSMAQIDMGRDARKGILLSGYNPILERAVAIIIDPMFMDGASPRHARPEVPGHDRDVARYYITIPESPILEHFLKNRNFRLNCELFNSEQFFSVLVKGRFHKILFDFDESLAPTVAAIYRIRGDKRIVPRGSIKLDWIEQEKSLYAEYVAELTAGVRYWDGEQWQPHPVVNGSYERIKAEAEAAGRGGAAR